MVLEASVLSKFEKLAAKAAQILGTLQIEQRVGDWRTFRINRCKVKVCQSVMQACTKNEALLRRLEGKSKRFQLFFGKNDNRITFNAFKNVVNLTHDGVLDLSLFQSVTDVTQFSRTCSYLGNAVLIQLGQQMLKTVLSSKTVWEILGIIGDVPDQVSVCDKVLCLDTVECLQQLDANVPLPAIRYFMKLEFMNIKEVELAETLLSKALMTGARKIVLGHLRLMTIAVRDLSRIKEFLPVSHWNKILGAIKSQDPLLLPGKNYSTNCSRRRHVKNVQELANAIFSRNKFVFKDSKAAYQSECRAKSDEGARNDYLETEKIEPNLLEEGGLLAKEKGSKALVPNVAEVSHFKTAQPLVSTDNDIDDALLIKKKKKSSTLGLNANLSAGQAGVKIEIKSEVTDNLKVGKQSPLVHDPEWVIDIKNEGIQVKRKRETLMHVKKEPLDSSEEASHPKKKRLKQKQEILKDFEIKSELIEVDPVQARTKEPKKKRKVEECGSKDGTSILDEETTTPKKKKKSKQVLDDKGPLLSSNNNLGSNELVAPKKRLLHLELLSKNFQSRDSVYTVQCEREMVTVTAQIFEDVQLLGLELATRVGKMSHGDCGNKKRSSHKPYTEDLEVTVTNSTLGKVFGSHVQGVHPYNARLVLNTCPSPVLPKNSQLVISVTAPRDSVYHSIFSSDICDQSSGVLSGISVQQKKYLGNTWSPLTHTFFCPLTKLILRTS